MRVIDANAVVHDRDLGVAAHCKMMVMFDCQFIETAKDAQIRVAEP